MKAHKSIRFDKSTVSVGGDIANTIVKHITNVRGTARSRRATGYPPGSIGSNLSQRNYVHYLVTRYHRFREADASFGRFAGNFSYAVIFKNIEQEFDVPTYFIPRTRFGDLVTYLHRRIDGTILGKRNRADGSPNYVTFDEFEAEQAGDQRPATPGRLLNAGGETVDAHGIHKPPPIIGAATAKSCASALLAARLVASGVRAGGPIPDDVWSQIKGLPGLRIDRNSFLVRDYDVIYRMTLRKNDGTGTVVWARRKR